MSKPIEDLSRSLWQFLIYPDSCGFDEPDDLWKALDGEFVPMFVSPLHDRDVKEDGTGELKKAHWHVLVCFDGPKPYKQVLYQFEKYGVKILKDVPSRRTCERYWAHLDSPYKALYDVADCRCFGGYKPKFLSDEYEHDGLSAVHDLVEQMGIVYYADLANEIIERHPDLIGILLRYPAHFNNFCYSRERMLSKSRDNMSYVKSRVRMGRC